MAAEHVAYHLTLLTTALDHPGVLLPSLLIIDSPRKSIGTTEADRDLGRRIYTRLETLIRAYDDKIQLIVADNDIPPTSSPPIPRSNSRRSTRWSLESPTPELAKASELKTSDAR